MPHAIKKEQEAQRYRKTWFDETEPEVGLTAEAIALVACLACAALAAAAITGRLDGIGRRLFSLLGL
jgi:hypothetical protein